MSTEPGATSAGGAPPLTPQNIILLFRVAIREARTASQTAEDAMNALLKVEDPFREAAALGQQVSILKTSQKKAERMSIQAIALISALRDAEMQQTTVTRETLKGADEILKLASQDPSMTNLLGGGA
ncbi:MAG: hypothetical protein AAF514_12960 [Verrucomicrobiota bacterium]